MKDILILFDKWKIHIERLKESAELLLIEKKL
jgi:hypothetical protein